MKIKSNREKSHIDITILENEQLDSIIFHCILGAPMIFLPTVTSKHLLGSNITNGKKLISKNIGRDKRGG